MPLRQDARAVLSTKYGGFPSPPYDYCEVAGVYGRYWNDEERRVRPTPPPRDNRRDLLEKVGELGMPCRSQSARCAKAAS